MNRIINWGLIGLGNASLNLAKEFNKINNSKLVAVASLTKEKRDYFSSNFNFDKKNIYSDYEKILKNKLLDIVYIGLPNSMHEELCLRALDNNKNVLIEKPITTNLKSFNKIKKKFYEKKLLIQEGTANKFHPFYKQVLNYFKTLEQSKIIKIKSSFGNDALGGKKIFGFRFKRINNEKRLFNKDLGGGSILDGGIYPVSLIVDIFNLYNINFLNEIKDLTCQKKKSNNIDLNSKLNFFIDKSQVELETSLIDNLDDSLEVYTNNENIHIKNIYNISLNSSIIFSKNNHQKKIFNKDEKSSYFYEICETSNLLNKNSSVSKNFNDEFIKIEKNIDLLSKWFNS